MKSKLKADKDFEKWALKQLKSLQDDLLLNDFYPIQIEPSEDNTECQFCYPYKTITIRYSDELLDDWKKGRINEVIYMLTHEMCHAITDPLYSKAMQRFVSKEEIEDERERLTDHIANIVIKLNLL